MRNIESTMIQKHRFKIDKLIRDKIPDFLNSRDIQFSKRVMEQDEFIQRLKNKLMEESKEVVDASSQDELVEEIADVLEVLHTLLKVNNLTLKNAEQKRIEKHKKSGGFENRFYNAYVEIDSNNSNIHYYFNRPNDYPEI